MPMLTQGPTNGFITEPVTQALSSLYAQFLGYWRQIKSSLSELVGLESNLGDLQQRWQALANWASQTGNMDIAQQANDGMSRVGSLQSQWAPNAQRIHDWLPTWLQAEQDSGAAGSGLGQGILTPVLLMAAIAALAWVVSHGFDVLRQYRIEQQTLEAVEQQKLTAEQARTLGLTVAPSGGLLSSLSSWSTWVLIGSVAVGVLLMLGSRR